MTTANHPITGHASPTHPPPAHVNQPHVDSSGDPQRRGTHIHSPGVDALDFAQDAGEVNS